MVAGVAFSSPYPAGKPHASGPGVALRSIVGVVIVASVAIANRVGSDVQPPRPGTVSRMPTLASARADARRAPAPVGDSGPPQLRAAGIVGLDRCDNPGSCVVRRADVGARDASGLARVVQPPHVGESGIMRGNGVCVERVVERGGADVGAQTCTAQQASTRRRSGLDEQDGLALRRDRARAEVAELGGSQRLRQSLHVLPRRSSPQAQKTLAGGVGGAGLRRPRGLRCMLRVPADDPCLHHQQQTESEPHLRRNRQVAGKVVAPAANVGQRGLLPLIRGGATMPADLPPPHIPAMPRRRRIV